MALSVGLWIYTVAISCLILFAILSNSFVIYCVIRYRKLRTVTNVFICNLAVADIFLAGFVMPQKLHDISHEEDFYEGDILCKIVNFSPVFIITSSIYSLVAVSFERKRAILEVNRTQLTFAFLKRIVPVIWAFGFAVSLPTLIEYRVNTVTKTADDNITGSFLSCGSQHMSSVYSIINAIFVVIVSYIVPVILMFNNYLKVAVFLWRKGKQINNSSGPNAPSNNESFQLFKNKFKIVKLLVVVAVIFAVSWLPFFITLLYAKITSKDASDDASSFVNLFLIALATFSTAYNVVLYVMYNPGFRRALQQLLRRVPRQNTINAVSEVSRVSRINPKPTTSSAKNP